MNIPTHTKSQEIFSAFLKDGVTVAEDFFTDGEVTIMRDELMPHYDKMKDGDLMVHRGKTEEQGYPFGKMIRITEQEEPADLLSLRIPYSRQGFWHHKKLSPTRRPIFCFKIFYLPV
jgi:hypothetical protein